MCYWFPTMQQKINGSEEISVECIQHRYIIMFYYLSTVYGISATLSEPVRVKIKLIYEPKMQARYQGNSKLSEVLC